MMSILEKLYYGEIRPCEKPAQNTKRYAENRETICSTEEEMIEMFPDCRELLTTYTDALCIEAQLECEADFERGFLLGARLAIEILNNNEKE